MRRQPTMWQQVVLAYLVSSVAHAQLIPGLDSSTPPKVMVIFDTSMSMRLKPDKTDFNAFGTDGTRNYTQHDFDPSNPTAPCENRFCIGKSVLSSTLPNYSDAIDLGLAGYFQFRTRYQPGTSASTSCLYDVLAAPNQVFYFTDPSSTLGPSGVPPQFANCNANGGASAHQYPINYVGAASGGAPVSCTVYNNTSPFNLLSAPNTAFASAPGCSSSISTGSYNLTGASVPNYFGALNSQSTSPLYVQFGKGATCPTAGTLVRYNFTNHKYSTTAGTTNGVPLYSVGLAQLKSPLPASSPTADYSTLASCGSGNFQCNLTFTNSGQNGTETANATAYNYTATTRTDSAFFPARVYTYVAPITPALTTVIDANAADQCVFPGSTIGTTTVNQSQVVYSNPLAFGGSSLNCTNVANAGCRITLTKITPGGITAGGTSTTAGTWSNIPQSTSPTYGTTAPPTKTHVCDGTGASVAPAYVSTPGTVSFDRRAFGASCPAATCTGCAGNSSNMLGTAASGGPFSPTNWSSGAVDCAANGGCQFSGGTQSGSSSIGTFNSPQTIAGSTASITNATGYYDRAATTELCLGNQTGRTTNLGNISCSSTNKCDLNFASLDLTQGNPGASSTFVSDTNQGASVTNSGVTYSNPVASYTSAGETLMNAGDTCVNSPSTTGSGCSNPSGCAQQTSMRCTDLTSNPKVCLAGTSADATTLRYCARQWVKYTYSSAPTPMGRCNYSYKRYVYSYPLCLFSFKEWNRPSLGNCDKTVTNPDVPYPTSCTFSVSQSKYSYPDPNRYCQVYGVTNKYTGNTPTVSKYSFNTKGGEYIGQAMVDSISRPALGSDNFCSKNPPLYTPIATDCPAVIDNSNSASFGVEAQNRCKNGQVCKLRWRSQSGSFVSGRASYFFGTVDTTYDPTTPRCLAPDRTNGELAAPPTAQALMTTNAAANFCAGSNASDPEQIRLRSDWYQPTITNTAPPGSAAPFFSQSTNQQNKWSGWSRNADGGRSDIFVPIGPGSSTISSVQKALSKCVRPADLMSEAAGGLCWADSPDTLAPDGGTRGCGPNSSGECYLPNTPNQNDFTPLYGSLVNARDYFSEQLSTDNQDTCRDYFVLLVTDGLEGTPVGYTQDDLKAAVTSLRATSASGHANKDVKTFVIGFGAGLASDSGVATDLDIIARTGGTAFSLDTGNNLVFGNSGKALNATNRDELVAALNAVFSKITAGKFSRSRPTLTTDGNRVYMAYFERSSGGRDAGIGTPEWRGHLEAFGIDAVGAFSSKWDHADKLNAAISSSRVLKAMPSATALTLSNFDPTVAAVTGAVSASSAAEQVAIVKFTRNDLLGNGPSENFIGSAATRKSRMGAPVFSSPVLVAAPPFTGTYAGETTEQAFTSYAAFRSDAGVGSRSATVLLAGRDGIFRGIKDLRSSADCTSSEASPLCENGQEAWGIVPYEPLTNLKQFARGEPFPIIDGTPAVSDVCTPTGGNAKNCAAADWKTMAILPLRGGGREIYSFDISNVNAGSAPTPLWRFSDSDLGLTYSVPSMGRVGIGSAAKWVAFMGGGLNKSFATTGNVGGTDDGNAMFVLDVATGKPNVGGTANDTRFTTWSPASAGPANDESMISRPALYKRNGGVNVESAYYASSIGTIWAQRTAYGTPVTYSSNPSVDWVPGRFFDPFGTADIGDVYGHARTAVTYVNKANGLAVSTGCSLGLGSYAATGQAAAAGLPAALNLTNCNELTTRQPIFARPRALSLYDLSRVAPDLYFGTGDSLNLASKGKLIGNAIDLKDLGRNFFFAVNDSSFGTAGFSSKALWAVTFDPTEKVLGEPAFVSGAVVIATYKPPTSSACQNFGDSFLYAFDPRTGAPKTVLRDPAATDPTAYTSVVKKEGIGAISDLIAVNGNIYFGSSKGSVTRIEAKPSGGGGKVLGWRRVR
jgi:hypothetical protein